MSNQIYKFIALALALMLMSGCSTRVSEDIPDDGSMVHKEVSFPDLDKAWIKEGSFPIVSQLKKVRKGMNKDQIRYLIGHPHFSEGLYGVREWDYIFNFIDEKDMVDICQYKIVFDKDMRAKSFFFKPRSCEKYIGKEQKREVINLSSDVLFDFAKSNLKADGKIAIRQTFNSLDLANLKALVVVGHTDPIGSDESNLILSKKRANSVRDEFIKLGVSGDKIEAFGMGEKQQVKICSDKLKKAEYIKCLKPNRRVDIDIKKIN